MQINLSSNFGEMANWIDEAYTNQIPFIAALTLTKLAIGGREHVQQQMPLYIDRPTPYTVKGVRYSRASKRRLRSSIYIDRTRNYLRPIIEGGAATPRGRAFAEPVARNQKNKYGNLYRGRASRLINKPAHFSGTPKGRHGPQYAGVWQRYGRGRNQKLRMLIHWGEARQQRETFPFYKIGAAYVQTHFQQKFIESANQAISTARPAP